MLNYLKSAGLTGRITTEDAEEHRGLRILTNITRIHDAMIGIRSFFPSANLCVLCG
jgi:hypothetical protein